MGRLINGANGPFIGKAGSVIGYTVNGVGYIKGLYKKRTKPPKPGEILNRNRFTAAQFWLQPLQFHLKVGFKGYRERFQGFVAAKSWLMRNAIRVVDDEIVIDPALAKISSGSLPLPENIACTFQEPDTFRFSWTRSSSDLDGYDQAMAVVYNIEDKQVFGDVYGSNRDSGESLVVVNHTIGRTFHIYLAFIASDRSRQSDSVYLGKVEF